MAGRFDIQRPARGLLDLFGLKATGDSPNSLAPFINGSVELADLYLADRLTLDAAVSTTITGTGQWAFNLSPPAGAMWLVYHVSLAYLTNVNGASTYEADLELAHDRLTQPSLVMPNSYTGVLAAAARLGVWGWQYERPLLMRQGDTFIVNVGTYTGTGIASMPVLRLWHATLTV